MSKLKYALFALSGTVLVVSALGGPVYARNGEDDNQSTQTSTQSTSDSEGNSSNSGEGSSSSDGSRTRWQSMSETEKETAEQEHQSEAKKKAQDMMVELKKQHQDSTKELRQKKCDANKNGIEQRSSNYIKNSQKFLAHIDTVLTKVQAYKTDKNLTVENYDSLLADAQSAQEKAAASVAALEGLKPTLDCTDDTASTELATFKAAVQQAKTDLKDYRTAVKSLLTAVAAAQDTSEGEEQ